MRVKVAVFLSALALVAVTGADTPVASQVSDPSGQLGIWEGRWTFKGQIYQTAYSEGHSDSGVAVCSWSANHGYMTCNYFSDDPPHDDLSVLSYSVATKSFMHVSVHKDSPPSRATLTQNGNTWTTQRDIPDKGKTLVMQTRFDFLSPNEQKTTVLISADKGQTWTKMIEVMGVKAAGAA